MSSRAIAILVLLAASAARAEDHAPPRDVHESVRLALDRVKRAGTNWLEHKTCFSCHHQTLPMLAVSEAARAGFPIDTAWMKSQADRAHRYFADRTDIMRAGDHVEGGSFTTAYGFWALALDDRQRDETTELMTHYLLQIQGVARLNGKEPVRPLKVEQGRWRSSCRRAPMQASEIAVTTLALNGMSSFATEAQRPLLADARTVAVQWLAHEPLITQEDRVFRLWGPHQHGNSADEIRAMRDKVVAAQRDDGGWPQSDELQSDAYSTGETLFVLLKTGAQPGDDVVKRARDYLLRTQHADGSWLVETRVTKPVQPFFENGDPHGKHQFISTAATAWCAAALANLLPTEKPASVAQPRSESRATLKP